MMTPCCTPRAARPLATIALAAFAACGDSSGPSNLTATQMADRFDRIGGDYERQGNAETGAAMHGLAMLVRVSGRLSPAEVTIDGARSGGWYALAVQQTVPELPCPAGAPPWCEPLPGQGSRLVLAWQGANADRMLLITSDTSGTGDFAFDFEEDDFFEPMAIAFFMDRRSEAAWVADSGTVTTAYRRTGGACPEPDRAPEGVEFTCAPAEFDVATGLRAEVLDFEDPTPAVHRVRLTATDVAGVLMTITDWGTLELPGNMPDPFVPGLLLSARR